MKKTVSNPFVTLIVLLLSVFSSGAAFAAGEWTVNPADYRYDMSLYLDVAFEGNEETFDHSRFLVASFVGDECRGVAEAISGVDGCLYMRIRSNSESGEVVSFKLRDIQTGEVRDVEGVQIPFEANKAVGMPSDPYRLVVRNYYDVSITASEGGTVNVESGRYPEGTTLEVSAVPDDQYRFVDWSDGVTDADRTIVVNGDISLVANFTVNFYKLTYILDGEIYLEEEVAYGAKIEAAAAPEKEGYSFSGWEGLPEVMPASDVTVEGTFTVNSYKLTYVVDGAVYKEETLAYGAKIEAAAAPEKEGYSFSGWEGLPEVMPASDVTVEGSFTVNSYKLTYVVDGAVYKEETLAYGTKIEAAAAPEKEGYSFSGWEGLPEVMPASDVTVEGTFTVNSYKLTYVVDGAIYKEETLAYGTKIEAAAAPEKEGYSFSGWEGLPEVMPASDVTVEGSFTVNSYKLTYVVDGAVYKEETLAYGTKIEAAAAPEKEGYSFSGWEGLPEVMPASDVIVEGTFTVNSYKLTYMVDGAIYKEETLAYGTKIEAAAAPEKEGYSFSGWEGLPEVMPASDVTVEGSFTVNSYKLTYVVDGAVYKEETLAYGTKIEAAAAPEKEGYSFSGWEGLPEVMPASDVTVEGSFTVNSYKLTYMVDGAVYKEETLAYGTKIEAAAAPEKEGYSFSGWEGLPEVMPASDVTVEGSFTVNSYKLTYMVDGAVYKEETLAYGTKIEAAAAPEKEGYSFSGWEGLPEVMPASDVTVEGSFTVNSYKLTYMVDGAIYKEETLAYGTKIEAAAAPEKEGYSFSGWEGLPEVMPASDVTVEGSFTVNSYKLTYVVDGAVYKEETLAYGTKIEAAAAPEKEGYSFSGWEGLPEVMPASDVTVEGTFTVNSYKLTYVVDGTVYKEETLAYGTKIEAAAAPEKEGYSFSGWEGLPEVMPASDVTVEGSFTVNSYKLTYMVDGTVYKEETLAYGTKIEAAAAPEKEGYSFSGWEGLPEVMPASDITVTAIYDVNYYKLTVYLDGEVYFEAELEMGAEINIPDPELPSDKKFDGWIEEIPETMPSHDVEIHGTTSVYSGLSSIFADEDALYTVYSIRGVLLMKDVTLQEASKKLTGGFYIINGKKVMIR